MSWFVKFEALVHDRRARLVAATGAGLVTLVSLGFLAAAHSPAHIKPLAAVLPAQPLAIPIMRSLPEPMEMKGGAEKRSLAFVAPGRYVKPVRVAHR
jgi:hypothetical protein